MVPKLVKRRHHTEMVNARRCNLSGRAWEHLRVVKGLIRVELLINSDRSLDALVVLEQAKHQELNSTFFIGQEARCRHDLEQFNKAQSVA